MLYVARLCSAHSKRGRPQCNALNKIHFKTPLSAHIRMLLRSLASRSLRSNGEFESKYLNKKFILAYIKVRSPVLAFTKNFKLNFAYNTVSEGVRKKMLTSALLFFKTL